MDLDMPGFIRSAAYCDKSVVGLCVDSDLSHNIDIVAPLVV